MFGRFLLGVTVGAIALLGSVATAAGQVHDPAPIGPNQSFVGLVNNRSSKAIIEMACFGPSEPGEYGHPLAGQTLEVALSPLTSAVPLAFTGAAHEIDATYEISDTLEVLLAEFSSYYVQAPLSTSLSFPCSGTGVIPSPRLKAAHVPAPGSRRSRSSPSPRAVGPPRGPSSLTDGPRDPRDMAPEA